MRSSFLAFTLLLLGAAPTRAAPSVVAADPAAVPQQTNGNQQQRKPSVEVTLPPPGQRAKAPPRVTSENVLANRRIQEFLQHGFPVRLRYRLELWSAEGLFDDVVDQAEWDVVIRYSPLERHYEVVRGDGGDRRTRLGVFGNLTDVAAAVERPSPAPLSAPTERKRFYYVLALDVVALDVNDLDEVERWLRGEAVPLVTGRKNPGTAITRGIRTFLTRLLGSENQHYEARTRSFVPD